MRESKHPYRDPVEAIEKAAEPVEVSKLRGLRETMVFLRRAVDEGMMGLALVTVDRPKLARQIADLECNVRHIRDSIDPIGRMFRWVSVSILGAAVLGALYRLHDGGMAISFAVAIAAVFGLAAENCRRWMRLADEMELVAKDLREFCRAKELVATEELTQVIAATVRKHVTENAPELLPTTGVRVEHPPGPTDTELAPDAEVPAADSRTKREES